MRSAETDAPPRGLAASGKRRGFPFHSLECRSREAGAGFAIRARAEVLARRAGQRGRRMPGPGCAVVRHGGAGPRLGRSRVRTVQSVDVREHVFQRSVSARADRGPGATSRYNSRSRIDRVVGERRIRVWRGERAFRARPADRMADGDAGLDPRRPFGLPARYSWIAWPLLPTPPCNARCDSARWRLPTWPPNWFF